MSAPVTIRFTDFWPGFRPEASRIFEALKASHDVTLLDEGSDAEPDILFYSCFGQRHLAADCLKIYVSGENDFPDFNVCDYALSCVPSDCGGRNLRFPIYALDGLPERRRLSDSEALDRGFCSCVVSNTANADPFRTDIADALGLYRPVAYGGRYRCTTGSPVADKDAFLSEYRFNLACENSIVPGYVTEKITDAFAAATVPIYMGDRAVRSDFNPEAYIFAGDYDSAASLADAVRRIDSDPAAYLAMLRARLRLADLQTDFDTRLADFLCRIADNPRRLTTPYGRQGMRAADSRLLGRLISRGLLKRLLRRL